jgi:hypothetical protein
MSTFNKDQKAHFAVHLQSTDIHGLSIPPIRSKYLLQYSNSLIGRQLKTILQTSVFHLADLLKHDSHDKESRYFVVWKAVGELSALLWYPEIENVEEYYHDLDVLVANVLDAFGYADPGKITSKIKLHLLTHLVDDVKSFGILLGVITEKYEAYNAVFRYASILSNHQAPSRDIAVQLAEQEAMENRLAGGWWKDSDNEWVSSGPQLRAFSEDQPLLHTLVGWRCENIPTVASVKLTPLPRHVKGHPKPTRSSLVLSQTSAAAAVNVGEFDPLEQWHKCIEVVSRARDVCRECSWVFAESPSNVRSSSEMLYFQKLTGL